MSYCINPTCSHPENPDDILYCQTCGSTLLIEGQYRVLKKLGGGGCGTTYEIHDQGMAKVLKVLHLDNPKALSLFQQEAQVLAQLQHPGIPQVDSDSYFAFFPRHKNQPLHCIVMEKIAGEDLQQWLKNNGCPINEKLALKWLNQLTNILAEVHKKNFFHRDIKPANIMLRPNGQLALIDFGTVKEITATFLAQQNAGQPGTIIYSKGYTPTEQEHGHTVPQSDFFALGRTFVHLLTGHHPLDFYNPDTDELNWQNAAPHISPILANFLNELMARLPRQRPANTEVILEKLAEIEQKLYVSSQATRLLTHPPISKSPGGQSQAPVKPQVKPKGVKYKLLLVGIIALLGLVGLVGIIFLLIIISPRIYDSIVGNKLPPAPQNMLSHGEKMLISSETNPAKSAGIQEFSSGNFGEAIAQFRESLKINKNDPETLIYLNNAIAEQKSATKIGEKVEIAVSVPISGESNIAQEMLRGVAQAQSEFNCGLTEISLAITNTERQLNCSGSLNGKFLAVTIADDKHQPEIAEEVAKALVKNEKIIAVVGHYSSDMTLRAGKIYSQAELVAISPISTSTRLKNFSKFVFKISPSDDLGAQNLFGYLNQQNLADKKVAVALVPGNSYSESLAGEFEKLLPEKFVYKCDLSAGNFSAGDCVEQAQNQGAEVMLLVPAIDSTFSNVMGVINNVGGLKLLGGVNVYNPRVLKDAGQQAYQSNLVISVLWHRHPNSKFANIAQEFWNAEVNWRTATSYDATQTIIKALGEMVGNYQRGELERILSSPDFFVDGVTGKIRFGQLGDRQFSGNDKTVLVQVKPGDKAGKYIFVSLEQ